MSLESLIMDGLNNLTPRCAVSNFSALCGIASPARVSSALAGQRPFDAEDGPLYANVLRRMKTLADSVAPVPVDWSETAVIKTILADISAGTLHISIYQEQPIAAPEAQYNVFLDNQNFYFMRRGEDALGKIKIQGEYQPGRAVKATKECGDQLVAALAKTGHKATLIPSKTTDLDDGAFDDINLLWGSEERP